MRSRTFSHGMSDEERTALARLVAGPVFELIPLERARESAAALPPGAAVTVTVSVRLGLDATLGLSEWLSSRGHDVAPHLAARLIREREHLSDVLDRLRGAGIRKVFVVGGDGAPTGEIPDGLALIRAIHASGNPLDELGIPAYPEGHTKISSEVLLRDMREKQPLVHLMTTQMSFNPRAVADWIDRIRGEAVTLPIHLGIPGAVELRKLMTIATRIGVADSTRYLLKHRSLLGHLAQGGSFGPDAFLRDLAPVLANPRANVRALHLFTMNQIAATLAWQRRMLEELES
jgi:methylenetetrahydrofolate reductase (NADPH)